ncbi:MAG: hypothetical protein M2R45_01344 [Verrucomicrobia subdivision 3 bacterium]|nr:hypothetical protein [Limisphaerales bacterium]MCS1415209.1 hypothetical protein [Limisphaerales bacterium]
MVCDYRSLREWGLAPLQYFASSEMGILRMPVVAIRDFDLPEDFIPMI